MNKSSGIDTVFVTMRLFATKRNNKSVLVLRHVHRNSPVWGSYTRPLSLNF